MLVFKLPLKVFNLFLYWRICIESQLINHSLLSLVRFCFSPEILLYFIRDGIQFPSSLQFFFYWFQPNQITLFYWLFVVNQILSFLNYLFGPMANRIVRQIILFISLYVCLKPVFVLTRPDGNCLGTNYRSLLRLSTYFTRLFPLSSAQFGYV